MFDRLMNPGNREFVYEATATISRSWSTTGIQSRNLTIFRHLFLSRASRRTLRNASLAASRRAVTSSLRGDGAFGIATPSGDRPALDIPGPRTIASTMRSSSSSSPGISSTIWPRDITSTRSHSPASSSGSLDLTSSAVPASVRERNAV